MDDGAASVLWTAMRTDRMDDYLAEHRTSADTLGRDVSLTRARPVAPVTCRRGAPDPRMATT